MTELDGIISILKERVSGYSDKLNRDETGIVTRAGDGVARVFGLENVQYGELVEFEGGTMGMAMALDEDEVGCVLLAAENKIIEGMTVRRTGRSPEIPAGKNLLGRIVDPLGKPLDGMGEIGESTPMAVEKKAPSVLDRQPVKVPLRTGTLAIDSMVPIGRGQRELIIGDRQTGKTAIAIDAMIAQKDQGVICVYVAIGQKASSTAQIVETLRKHGALSNTVIVAATAGDPAALQYIAPYSGCAVAEYFMEKEKKDVLIVYDDLSKHAVAYRALSLLLRRPPGREAYPGDVFYLHSRLLERSARLSDELGGASITALPIVETQGGDISAYIPTNVISITDGQVFLQPELFFAGVRPAIDVGLSVSRVGGSAQSKAMRKVAGRLRLELAQYRELESFSQFGSDLDKSTQDRLRHGRILVEALKQGQYKPYSLSHEVVVLYAAVNGKFDEYVPETIAKTIEEYISFITYKAPEIFQTIEDSRELSAETTTALDGIIDTFRSLRKTN